jgi:hypothetical protein
MPKLTFHAADVRRVVEHSLSAPAQRDYMVDYDRTTFDSIMGQPEAPAVCLVHDDGVYLMSNGTPRDIDHGTHSFCAYAKGCNPKTDAGFYETARNLVGGDDFGEVLPWARELLAMLDRGETTITINFSSRGISLAPPKPQFLITMTRPDTGRSQSTTVKTKKTAVDTMAHFRSLGWTVTAKVI